MKCQKCKTEKNVHFTGFMVSWGPHPNEAGNTEENLPHGFSYLCEDCDIEIFLETADYQQQV
ncbi:MAG TPA: hypothetical protein VFI27_08825 [candidate division Zixibacteria bacterium]|nr:hypothetical protein [candidate division Zixibacteria bacterium]